MLIINATGDPDYSHDCTYPWNLSDVKEMGGQIICDFFQETVKTSYQFLFYLCELLTMFKTVTCQKLKIKIMSL